GQGSVATVLMLRLALAQPFLEIGGAPADPGLQGMGLVPSLRGDSVAWRDAISYQYFAYPDWHMVHRQYGVRTHRYKLIHYFEVGEWELFDLARDPQELRSVYDHPEYQDVVRELKIGRAHV